MKIALYVQSWPPAEHTSGIVTYASQLVPALRKLGHEVFILTLSKGIADSDPYTIDLRRFALSNRTLWDRAMFQLAPTRANFKEISGAIVSAIRELIDRRGLDVFEIEETFGWSYAIARMRLLPVVVRLHGGWHIYRKFIDPTNSLAMNRKREEFEGRGIYCAQLVTTPSAKVLELTRNYYGFDLTASRIIRNPLEAAAEEETWNAGACTNNTMLFVGRFDSLKGGDLVLRSFAELAALYPQLRLTFVGPDAGLNAAGGLLPFRQFVQSSLPESCHKRIDFRGPMNRADIMGIRREHFLTIVASQHEVMPYSVLEAISLGCPLVATAVGGIPEVISDQKNGLLVPSQNLGEMVAACKKLLDDRALAARLGRQAWQSCRDCYEPLSIARQTVSAYEQAIGRFNVVD